MPILARLKDAWIFGFRLSVVVLGLDDRFLAIVGCGQRWLCPHCSPSVGGHWSGVTNELDRIGGDSEKEFRFGESLSGLIGILQRWSLNRNRRQKKCLDLPRTSFRSFETGSPAVRHLRQTRHFRCLGCVWERHFGSKECDNGCDLDSRDGLVQKRDDREREKRVRRSCP